MAEHKMHEITAQYLEKCKQELDHLKNVEVEENKRALQEARALGDLSENSDYDFAKAEQGRINARIEVLEDIIKYHIIIAEEWYTVSIDGGKQVALQLVGVLEADPEESKISKESPIGKAITGHIDGEEVQYLSGAGTKHTVKIIAIGR